jgi:hypothetical protein
MVARAPLFLLAAITLVVSATLIGTPLASARTTTYPRDPAANIALPSRVWSPACTDHPMRHTCERIMVRALNRGRAKIGEPAYALPARFGVLGGREQLVVLTNLDRKLYRLSAIAGLNPTLNTSAQRGAAAGTDPRFVTVGGRQLVRAAANWAGGLRSPLAAYFTWMYQDADLGWQHRHNLLMPSGGSGNLLLMGVGSNDDASPDWTTVLESFAPPSTTFQCVPIVVALSARSATDADGSAVRLFGVGFLHVRQVTFGGVRATFTRTSLFTISAVPPAHAPGLVHVRVITGGGTSRATAAAAFTY